MLRAMTPKELQRMHEVCEQLATEQDPQTFDALVRELNALVKELNDLLEQKYERIHPGPR